jgi:hypothetical protein
LYYQSASLQDKTIFDLIAQKLSTWNSPWSFFFEPKKGLHEMGLQFILPKLYYTPLIRTVHWNSPLPPYLEKNRNKPGVVQGQYITGFWKDRLVDIAKRTLDKYGLMGREHSGLDKVQVQPSDAVVQTESETQPITAIVKCVMVPTERATATTATSTTTSEETSSACSSQVTSLTMPSTTSPDNKDDMDNDNKTTAKSTNNPIDKVVDYFQKIFVK